MNIVNNIVIDETANTPVVPVDNTYPYGVQYVEGMQTADYVFFFYNKLDPSPQLLPTTIHVLRLSNGSSILPTIILHILQHEHATDDVRSTILPILSGTTTTTIALCLFTTTITYTK